MRQALVQRQGGHPTLDLNVTAVKINDFVDITVPDNVRNAPAAAAPTATSQKVADGIFYATSSGTMNVGANSPIVLTADEALIVDSSITPAAGRALRATT